MQVEAEIARLREHGPSAACFSLAGQSMYGLLVSAYDGDTVTLVVPVLGQLFKYASRIEGIDTPEIKSKLAENKARAIRARNRMLQLAGVPIGLDDALSKKEVEALLARCKPVVFVECGGFEKYGRLLVTLRAAPGAPSFADVLLSENLAYVYGGGTKQTEAEQVDTLDG